MDHMRTGEPSYSCKAGDFSLHFMLSALHAAATPILQSSLLTNTVQQTHLISYFQGLPKEHMFENLPMYNFKLTVWFTLFKNTCTLSFPNSDLLCMPSAECCLHTNHNKGVLLKCRANQRFFTDKWIWASRYTLHFGGHSQSLTLKNTQKWQES